MANFNSQWLKRVHVIELIYSFIIKDEINIKYLPNTIEQYNLVDKDQVVILEYFLNNYNNIKSIITKNLRSDWSFNQLNLVEIAILSEGISEFYSLNTDKKIIIDQNIITAKRFCPEDSSWKLINAILDKVLVNE